MENNIYLSTEEAAAYLKLKERKLYDLAASGAVPCSKVTGKWLFPRAALDSWVEAGLSRPEGLRLHEPPAILGGSHDLLLEWAVRTSGCGLALLAEGSERGLERLIRNEVMLATIHLHDPATGAGANAAMVAAAPDLHDAVVISFARRELGLVLAAGNPLAITDIADAAHRQARFGQRQKGAGAQLLLEALLARGGGALAALRLAPAAYPTGQELAQAIRAGDIDCGIAARAVAASHGLAFAPLMWEDVDLVMRRRSYFAPPVQSLMTLIASRAFRRQAAALPGYDVESAGRVILNR